MNKKNIDIKKTLLDNGIIIVLLLLVLLTGITKDNFFSWNNLSNISVNTAARVIIAFGVSGCLITKGTDLSAGRMVGLASCIAGTLLQTADYLSLIHILGQAKTAADMAVKFLNGETVDPVNMVDYVKVTPDNAKDILDIIK